MKIEPLSIRKSDCKFYVNKEKRTIVCVIPNTEYILYDFIYGNFDFKDLDITLYGKQGKEICLPNSFMGKAVCSTEDEWDEELGRNLAYYRARGKLYRSFFRRAQSYLNKIDVALDSMIADFNTLGEKVENWQTSLSTSFDIKNKGEA